MEWPDGSLGHNTLVVEAVVDDGLPIDRIVERLTHDGALQDGAPHVEEQQDVVRTGELELPCCAALVTDELDHFRGDFMHRVDLVAHERGPSRSLFFVF